MEQENINKQINPFNQDNKKLNKRALFLIITTLVISIYSAYSTIIKKQNNTQLQTQIQISTKNDFIMFVNNMNDQDIKKIFIDSVDKEKLDENTRKLFIENENLKGKELREFIISGFDNMSEENFQIFKNEFIKETEKLNK